MKRLKCNVSKEELFEIEQKILKNNNLYKFRCEEYKKYAKQDITHFRKDYPKHFKEYSIFINTYPLNYDNFNDWLFDFIMNGGLDKK